MIRPSDFANWQEYYFTYQNILAKQYLIPMLEQWGVSIDGKKILEIGCGSGGVIEAFAERASKAVGVELNPFDYTKLNTPKVQYVTADIYDPSHRERYADKYDIILFRDVIEHLPKKKEAFEICDTLLSENGVIFITFPPYHGPYGAHQQVFSKTFLGRLPYTHLLPNSLYIKYVKAVEKGNDAALQVAHELIASQTTIGSLKKSIRASAFKIDRYDYYLVRPSYEIRYGKKPRKINLMKYLPFIREFFVLGMYMIMRRK
ncbi:MAG TPA: class I SAM-dependent methyltransferase [bacterium]|nr:class I SAM-dependent methyltransferase [bacterium]HMZ04722.1 class I SAM-dependent methyltransferase [bacterium]HNB10843.1 class I SAM-dependent methyltransferase [bacterium]HND76460.1 class I SAM-dependent methyltransferase [bacterium]HNE82601.1 class I SAM-dependent methyltransferase [bacterium]